LKAILTTSEYNAAFLRNIGASQDGKGNLIRPIAPNMDYTALVRCQECRRLDNYFKPTLTRTYMPHAASLVSFESTESRLPMLRGDIERCDVKEGLDSNYYRGNNKS